MNDPARLLHSPAAKQWQSVSAQQHHGIVIPLFSLHSSHSYGIGEYTDLIPLIDWCSSIGYNIIQLLPLNDTGEGTSPYSALSAFALNPIHLGLDALPFLEDHPNLKDELKALPKHLSGMKVDYKRVRDHKNHFLRHYYHLIGPRLIETEDYKQFLHQAEFWLKDYAAFKILKNLHHGANWYFWPALEKSGRQDFINIICSEQKEEFHWYCFLQFLCDQQLKSAKQSAARKNIYLMGDLPILVDRDSADVWAHQELFNLDYSAGSPPDMYSDEGQNWGFPLYRWNMMEAQNYHWWKFRLQWACRYYHIYRIDHIVGFFRIWSIPNGRSGKEGHYIPEDEALWIDHGQRIMLMMLDACEMLPIGEDLGIVPPLVRSCLSALGICGTRVMRWERRWNEDGEFIPPHHYPLDSLTTVSTHDSETLQQWWKNNPLEAQLYSRFKGWSYQPLLSREHHREILWDSHHSASLFHINPLQEYMALVPGLSWPEPEDDRINIPGICSDNNWSFRLRPSLEEISLQTSLKHFMQELIK